MSKKTLVIGASENPDRYSYKAVVKLNQYGHPVIALGKSEGKIDQIKIQTGSPTFTDIDTVSIYLSPANQEPVMDYILNLKPKRIIFNPGTENVKLEELAKKKGIETVEGCTLVMLSTNQF
jgi:predicted CoA-binding protein